jgi:hypothetical protein
VIKYSNFMVKKILFIVYRKSYRRCHSEWVKVLKFSGYWAHLCSGNVWRDQHFLCSRSWEKVDLFPDRFLTSFPLSQLFLSSCCMKNADLFRGFLNIDELNIRQIWGLKLDQKGIADSLWSSSIAFTGYYRFYSEYFVFLWKMVKIWNDRINWKKLLNFDGIISFSISSEINFEAIISLKKCSFRHLTRSIFNFSKFYFYMNEKLGNNIKM